MREWRKKLKEKVRFVMDVLQKPKILLVGSDDELAELSGGKP